MQSIATNKVPFSWLRVVAMACGSLLLGNSILLAQVDIPVDSSGRELDLLKWAINQGGLAVVTIIILWSYRKDSREWLQTEQERVRVEAARNLELMQLVVGNTTAMTQLTETSRHMAEELKTIRLMRGGHKE